MSSSATTFTTRLADKISAEQITEFQQNGAICLRGLFDKDWLEQLAVGVEKNFADPGPWNTVYTPEGEQVAFMMTTAIGSVLVNMENSLNNHRQQS